MRKAYGKCINCGVMSEFEILTIRNQVEKSVLADCQCKKCSALVFVHFEVTENGYKKIEAKGKESDDHENSPPHSTPQSDDF